MAKTNTSFVIHVNPIPKYAAVTGEKKVNGPLGSQLYHFHHHTPLSHEVEYKNMTW